MSQNQPAASVTLGEAPTWDELFENGFPVNRDALLLTDVLDYLEITQPNNVTTTFGDIRQHAINGTTGNEQKDKQIKKLSTFVMLKPGYTNGHMYIPPDLRQTIISPIVFLDSIYKACFVATHYLRNTRGEDREIDYDSMHNVVFRVDGLAVRLATEHHPMRRLCQKVYLSRNGKVQKLTFDEYEIKPAYECRTFLTQRVGWGNMNALEKAEQDAVNRDISEVTSGKHIHKLPDPGTNIVITGGAQRMDVIDNQTIPNIQIKPEWLKRYVGKNKRIDFDDELTRREQRTVVRQAVEAVTRVEEQVDTQKLLPK